MCPLPRFPFWPKVNLLAVGFIFHFLLTACGGGGGDGASNDITASPCESGSGALTLCEIQISVADPEIVAGTKQNLRATGIYSDLSKADITEQVQWSSSAEDVISIENQTGNKGKITGLAEGSAIISASLDGEQPVTAHQCPAFASACM